MKKILITFFLITSLFLVACDNEPDEPVVEKNIPTLDRMTLASPFALTGSLTHNASRKVLEVITVHDGDTATFKIAEGTIKVRFYGIDTPETHHPTLGEQPWGRAASNYAKDKIANAEEIIVQFDIEAGKTDSYDRYLGWIWIDGSLFQYDICEAGLANIYSASYDSLYGADIRVANATAKDEKVGIHSGKDPNWDYENNKYKENGNTSNNLSQEVIEYYSNVVNLTGQELKDALNDLISNHTEFPYSSSSTDTWDILNEADEDPNNSDNIIAFYTGQSIPKNCQVGSKASNCINGWNREHVWSKSRGDFGTSKGAGTDTHNLQAEEESMNNTKANRFFADCNDGDDTNVVDKGFGNFTCNSNHFEPRDEVKGDVARIIFYMTIRYEGENGEVDLEMLLGADDNSKSPEYGDLNDLLRWHLADPVSETEMNRNEVIFKYQNNRNPFIDYPEFVNKIFIA